MPAAIPVLIVGAVQGGLALATGGAFLAAFLKGVIVTAVLTGASKLLQRKPDIQDSVRNRQFILRSAMSPHRTIVGEPPPVSGTLVYADTTGEKKEYLWMMVVLSGHEVHKMLDVYLDNRRISHEEIIQSGGVDTGAIATDGVSNGKWTPHVSLWRYAGSDAQTANASLTSASSSRWTTNHRLRGRAYILLRLRNNLDTTPFPTGIPTVKVAVRGARLYDPRDGVTRYSNNPALVIRHYLTSPAGLNCSGAELDDATFAAAANVCDERVPVESYTSPSVTLNVQVDQLQFQTADNRIGTGDGVQLQAGSSIAGTGLATGITYYVIRTSRVSCKLAATYADAIAGNAINITGTTGAIITLLHVDQARYTCDGSWDADQSPRAILDALLTSLSGTLDYTGGIYRLHAGAYTPAVLSLSESDLRGPLQYTPRPTRSELFNALRPIYADPFLYGQVTDAAVVTDAAMVADDGGAEVVRDLQLPYTINPIRAQRIAKSMLTRARKGVLVLPCKLSAFRLQVNDVVSVSISRMGWSAKTFRVVGWKMAADPAGIGVDLTLVEESSADWGWTAGEATVSALQLDLDLPVSDVAAPFTVQAFSGGAEVLRAGDGTIISRMRVTWQSPAEPNLSGYEIRYKRASEATYSSVSVPPDATVHTIAPVNDGDEYSIGVRALGIGPARSPWASITHTVIGKTAPPAAPTGLTATPAMDAVLLKWNNPPDQDLAGTEVWEAAVNDRTQALLLDTVGGNTYTRAAAGGASTTRRYWVRAKDTSGNYSPFHPLGATAGIAGTPNSIPASTIPRVDVLPPNNADYNLVLLNSNNKLYRWAIPPTGTPGWVTWTAGTDILAQTVTADQLAANSVVAGKIAANAIVAGDGVIGALAVQTLQLANQAVTIPVSVSAIGPFGVALNGWTNIISLTFQSSGAPVWIHAQCRFNGNAGEEFLLCANQMRIIRNGANGQFVTNETRAYMTSTFGVFGVLGTNNHAFSDVPGAGSVTYTLQCGWTGQFQTSVSHITMFAIETKK